MSALVELDGVSKRFGEGVALEPIDLRFESGRTTAVIGPSGCGKSTLLRLIIGLLQPDTGTIRIDGTPLDPAAMQAHRHGIGYVIQEGGLFPHLTARDNITLMARNLKRDEGKLAGRIDELCQLTRFPGEALARYPLELSGGQRQRVSLMRALMLEPKLLLLDEPLGALDPLVRAQLQRELRDIFVQLEQTALLVTHDLHEAGYLAQHIVLMNQGRLVQQGSVDELRRRPAEPFVKEFFEAQHALTA